MIELVAGVFCTMLAALVLVAAVRARRNKS